ncbi:MAG: hypothetical protein P8J27_07290 [Mariniblastus sp.]|nr:hypothetical protein [Mariniblastus sp.]
MESDSRMPSGQWSGFYLEKHQPKRGWMHLYFAFNDGKIKAEGTDYVGPWVAEGQYDLTNLRCNWLKHYVAKHSVAYRGQISEKGIMGEWSVSLLSGQFHVWPKSLTVFDELYLSEDLKMAPQTPLPGVHPRGKPEFDLTSFD